MHTRLTVLITVAVLAVLSVVAMILAPGADKSGQTVLKWATDPCPQREPQVDAFNKLNPDCRLEIDPDNSGVMKVVVQCSAHMGPDLIDHVTEETVQTYADSGILLDITDQAKRLGCGIDTLPEPIRPLVQMTVIEKDGSLMQRQFGYPCNFGHTTLFFNKNLFDKYHVPYPSSDLTWDEYIKLAQKMTIFAPGKSAVPEIFGAAGAMVKVIALEKGGDYFNRWGTVSTVDSAAFIAAYQMYHDLMFKYNIEPSPNQKAGVSSQGGWGCGYINWFGEGKIAMFWGSRWMMVQLRRCIAQQKQIRDEWLQKHPGANPADAPEVLRLGCVLLPRFADGPRVVPSFVKSTGINANSPNKEKALKFMAYLAGEKYSAIINRGSDGLPGNQKYNHNITQLLDPAYPGEEEVHQTELNSIPYGRIVRFSPFVNNAVVNRIMQKVVDKMVTAPGMSHQEIAMALRHAAREINTIIAQNIARNPQLGRVYKKLLEKGAEPILIDNAKNTEARLKASK